MPDRKTVLAALAGFSLAAAGAAGLHAATAPTPKGYLLAEIDVTDAAAFQNYASQTPPIIARHGGRYLARGGRTIPLEGGKPAGRVVLLEFPSADAARDFVGSPEYQKIAAIRHQAASSRVFVVEGVAPQP